LIPLPCATNIFVTFHETTASTAPDSSASPNDSGA
jgi:hypothetical protein